MACTERVAGWFLIGIFISGLVALILSVAQEAGQATYTAPPSVMGIALTVVIAVLWWLIRMVGHSGHLPVIFYTRQGRPHELFTPLYDQR